MKGGKDLISIYVNNHPDSEMFDGKGLAIGGSNQINQFNPNANSYYGDVSAVILKNLPLWAQFVRTPSLEIALMDKWEEKIEKMAIATSKDNVTSLTGAVAQGQPPGDAMIPGSRGPTWPVPPPSKVPGSAQSETLRTR